MSDIEREREREREREKERERRERERCEFVKERHRSTKCGS